MTDHFKKTATAVVVVLICFEVLGELVYASGKNGYLYLGRARVALMSFVSGDYFLLFLFGHFFITFHFVIPHTEQSAGDVLPENPACGKSSYRFVIIHYIFANVKGVI